MIRRALAIFVVMLMTAPMSYTKPQTGNVIRGKIRNQSGVTMGHVVVVLNVGVGGMINQTVTNEEGDFTFASLTGTSYTITIGHPGYQPYSESVSFFRQVSEGQPAEIKTVFVTLEASKTARVTAPRVVFVQEIPVPARDAYERGLRFSRENKLDQAMTSYKEAIDAFPRYYDAHFALGCELIKTGRSERAIGELEAARQINAKDDRVYACFGQALISLKKFAVAAAAYNEAARLRPDESSYPYLRACALIDQARALGPSARDHKGLLDAAEIDLGRAYELSGKSMSAVHIQRARLYEQRGDAKRAADELASYLRANPNADNAAAIREAVQKLNATAAGN
jgi:tetratricopeptide (TPR) repeat protein